MKRLIAIFCFTALLLSTSSLTYFYWVQEKMHQQERFAQIESGLIKANQREEGGGFHQIRLVLKDKFILPVGYEWEEEGREFSYNGHFYDIVSLKYTTKGWELIAASDEAETILVNNKNKANNLDKETSTTSTSSNTFKIKLSKLVYDYVAITQQGFIAINMKTFFSGCNDHIAHPFLAIFSPPPQAV